MSPAEFTPMLTACFVGLASSPLKNPKDPDDRSINVGSFLCDRQQRVKLSQYVSEWLTLKGVMQQGSYLGQLIFLVLINDLRARCLLHKFMDDTMLSEIIVHGDCSKMSTIMSDVINWTSNNLMNINWDKTKEMLITTSRDMLCDALCVSNNTIERVHSYKLLGVTVNNNLKCAHTSILFVQKRLVDYIFLRF